MNFARRETIQEENEQTKEDEPKIKEESFQIPAKFQQKQIQQDLDDIQGMLIDHYEVSEIYRSKNYLQSLILQAIDEYDEQNKVVFRRIVKSPQFNIKSLDLSEKQKITEESRENDSQDIKELLKFHLEREILIAQRLNQTKIDTYQIIQDDQYYFYKQQKLSYINRIDVSQQYFEIPDELQYGEKYRFSLLLIEKFEKMIEIQKSLHQKFQKLHPRVISLDQIHWDPLSEDQQSIQFEECQFFGFKMPSDNYYVPPECQQPLNQTSNDGIYYWNLGIILYTLLCQSQLPLFQSLNYYKLICDDASLFQQFLKDLITHFDSLLENSIFEGSELQIIFQLLSVDPQMREKWEQDKFKNFLQEMYFQQSCSSLVMVLDKVSESVFNDITVRIQNLANINSVKEVRNDGKIEFENIYNNFDCLKVQANIQEFEQYKQGRENRLQFFDQEKNKLKILQEIQEFFQFKYQSQQTGLVDQYPYFKETFPIIESRYRKKIQILQEMYR